MPHMLTLALAVLALSYVPSPSTTQAGEVTLKTNMMTAGTCLTEQDFSTLPSQSWSMLKGDYQPAGNSVAIRQVAADNHAAVMRFPVEQADFIAQFDFKFDGAKTIGLSINDPKGHCCRVVINPAGVQVRKDSHDHGKADPGKLLDQSTTPIPPGQWQTLTVELSGSELVASIDGTIVALGEHDSFQVEKSNIGIVVSGESASIRNFALFNGNKNSNWHTQKADFRQAHPVNDSPTPAKKPVKKKT